MVLDAQGRKMSKSKGNVINPLDLTEKYGTDALRMSLVVGNTPGTSLALAENKIKAYKHFANKIWNASRFVLENLSEASGDLIPEDQKIMEEFGELVKDITADMEGYRFYLAAEKIYHYFWHTFADIIIEKKKKEEDKRILKILLEEQLKLLHPFMPFITEKIWSMMGDRDGLLLVEKWPV